MLVQDKGDLTDGLSNALLEVGIVVLVGLFEHGQQEFFNFRNVKQFDAFCERMNKFSLDLSLGIPKKLRKVIKEMMGCNQFSERLDQLVCLFCNAESDFPRGVFYCFLCDCYKCLTIRANFSNIMKMI